MMNKWLIVFLVILFGGTPKVVCAYDFESGGIYYSIIYGDIVSVTSGDSKYIGDIVIPNQVSNNGRTYNVTSILGNAFQDCTSLSSITIPNSVTSISANAFKGCTSLSSISIPNSVTSIGWEAFEGTAWYNNQSDGLVYAGKVAYKYKGVMPANTHVTIKEGTIGIAVSAFEDCSMLTSINIPNSVICIGSYAFDGTAWYNSQPDGVVYAGKVAYKYKGVMPANTHITIKNGTLGIAGWAFFNLDNLTSITIPNSVTSIVEGAFFGSGLTSVKVESGNIRYDSRNNCNAIIETSSNTLIIGCKNTIIPNTVTAIGNSAFECCFGLTSVKIPSSVSSIGCAAFNLCRDLTSVTIPESVIFIGSGAFSQCDRLNSVNIPNSVTSIGSSAFYYCGLTSITIPNSVTSIGDAAFWYCTNLPSITIPNSVTSIGRDAFRGCSNLKNVVSEIQKPFKIGYYVFEGIPSDAELIVPKGTKAAYLATEGWNKFTKITESTSGGEETNSNTPIDYSKQPFTIVAIEAGAIQFAGTFSSTIDNASIEYSIDRGNTWVTLNRNNTLSVSSGQKVYFRSSTLSPIGYVEGVGNFGIGTFSSTGRFNVEGNILSLYYGDDFRNQTSLSGKQYAFVSLFSGCTNLISIEKLVLPATDLSGAHWCYSEMFYGCTSLTSAPELPATTLAPYCYVGMFQGCTSLSTAPALIATTLTSYCYARMFNGCTSLTTSPALPATTLTAGCYAEMFNGCKSLTAAPELPATTLESECYNQMFSNCTSLVTAPALPATTLAPSCYGGMFYGCNSLTTSPALPATTLVQSCYHSMFDGCTSLTTAPELPATTLADWCYVRMFENCTSLTAAPSLPAIALTQSCYSQMFSNCTSLATAPALPATTLAPYCYYQMFIECTSLTTAPVLPAKTLVEGCYYNMFSVCTSLNFVKCLATDVSANECTAYWLSFVPSTGTFVKASSMINWSKDASGIPEGWTIQNDEESSTSNFSNDGLTYIVDTPSLTAEVTLYDQSKSSVTIPETVSFDGRIYRVTSIGKFAFYQCRNVLSVTIPNSVTSIGSSAFEDCSALTSVSLGSGLSSIGGSAFEDCTSLSTITIPASVTSIALNAFKNCSNLKNVTSEILTPFAIQDNVFDGIASGATLTVPKGTKSAYQSTTGWNKFTKIMETTTGIDDPATQYFTFVAKENGTFSFSGTSSDKVDNSVIYYSLDSGASWTALARNVQSPTIQAGKRIMFKGTLTPLYYEVNNGEAIVGIGGFSSTGRFDVEGNIMSLLFGDNFIGKTNLTGKDHTFYELFLDCTGLINAGNLVLPATTLADNCYEGMFRNCTSLTIAPQLPATKLPNCCYEGMFYNCTSLTTAPQLLATSLGISCYSHMFGLCTSLSIAPKLPAVALAEKCYRSMFRGCMSLTKAPQLPATTLTSQCYEFMFDACTSLKEITCLATDISASECTSNWLSNVASAGTFIKSSSMNSWPRGVNGIPINWTIRNDNGSSTNEVTINSISYVVDNSTFTAEVKSVGNSLRSVSIPESINYNGTEYRVTSLAERSFEGRDDITYLSIPSSITSIGEYAFLDCGSNIKVNIESLEAWCKMKFANKLSCPLSSAKAFYLNDVEVKSLSIPSGVTSISSYAFFQCRSITSLSIPSTVTSIGSSVFEDCTSLTSVILSKGLTSIGGSSFEGCTRIVSITLPSTITSIALNAFKECNSLNDITSEIQQPFAINDNVFSTYATATLKVPAGTKLAYQSTAGWYQFKNITDGQDVVLTANSYTREYGDPNPVFDFTREGDELIGTPSVMQQRLLLLGSILSE